ncbi:MAG: hypothetical protein AAF645_04765 [Myxococcota bacterium]
MTFDFGAANGRMVGAGVLGLVGVLLVGCSDGEIQAVRPQSVGPVRADLARSRASAAEARAAATTAAARASASLETDSAVFIDGYGGRFALAPDTDLVAAPVGPNARPGSLMAAHRSSGRLFNTFVRLHDGSPELIGNASGDVVGIENVGEGSADERWSIELNGARVHWPAGYKLQVLVPDRGFFFQLAPIDSAERDVLIFVRGPFPKSSFPSELVALGQEVISDVSTANTRRLELRYDYGGTTYRQLHFWHDLGEQAVLITGQAIDGRHAPHLEATEAIARSFALVQ